MSKWLKRLALTALAAGIAGVLVVWALLQASVFNDLRARILEDIISAQIGYRLVVEGAVKISPGRVSTFEISRAHIPSDLPEGIDLVRLDFATLQADSLNLIRGRPDFDTLSLEGLSVNFVRTEDDRVSWQTNAMSDRDAAADPDGNVASSAAQAIGGFLQAKKLLDFVIERSDSFESVSITIDDRRSGFDFAFFLDEMTLIRGGEGQKLQLVSSGTVNEDPFAVTSTHLANGSFRTEAGFGASTLLFEGVERQEQNTGYSGKLTLLTGQIGDLLDVLRLNRVVEGTAGFSVDLDNDGTATEILALNSYFELGTGVRFGLTGAVENLEAFSGVNLTLDARFHPEGAAPPPALRLSQLKLVNASARIVGDRRALTIEDARIRSNAFEETLNELGPISVGSIRRTPQGTLALNDVTVMAGPPDAPVLVASGSMRNALEGKDFEFDGRINARARFLLADLAAIDAEDFGGISGAFRLTDANGYPQLASFSLTTVDTDLWSLNAHAEGGESGHKLDFEMDVDLGIADTAVFLGALGLDEIDISPLGLDARMTVRPEHLIVGIDFEIGASAVSAEFDAKVLPEKSYLTGHIGSDEVRLGDLNKLVRALLELKDLNLVLRGAGSDAEATDVQPLVLKTKDLTLEDLLLEVGMQPLVIPEEQPIDQIFELDNILRQADVDIGVNIAKLSGIKGVSRIATQVTSKDGLARVGPVDLSYGGGFARVEASMDVIGAPDIATVTGRTGGWDLGTLFGAAGIGLDAQGQLGGTFRLTGRNDGLQDFVNSMQGSVDLSLDNGAIATSLLELAGLGVIPWLFSSERRQKNTAIVCLRAPLRLRAGRVAFDPMVAETTRVQMVAKGEIDWRRDRISLRAEPRPVGSPLSRSAWPVDITGKLSAPQVKPQIGGARQRRADGADVMPDARTPCVPDIYQLEAR